MFGNSVGRESRWSVRSAAVLLSATQRNCLDDPRNRPRPPLPAQLVPMRKLITRLRAGGSKLGTDRCMPCGSGLRHPVASSSCHLQFHSFGLMLYMEMLCQAGARGVPPGRSHDMELYYKDLISEDASLEQLVDELTLAVQGADELGATSALDPRRKQEILSRLERIKHRYAHMRNQALATARATDRIVRRSPYSSLGMAFLAGLVVGLVVQGRRGAGTVER